MAIWVHGTLHCSGTDYVEHMSCNKQVPSMSCDRSMTQSAFWYANMCFPLLLQSIMASDFNHLDFDMTQQQRERLLIRGMEAGRRFLEK